MRTDPAAARLAADSRSLDALRSEAARNPAAASRQAAVQFETLFMQMVMKSMRDATPKADGNPGGDTFASMLDTQFARQFAGRPNGLADMIEKQLTRHMQNLPAPSESAAAPRLPAAPAAAAPAVPAPAAGSSPTPTTATRSRAASFIETMLPHARHAERQTGVPASFILGQAALESGWGRREIHNADGTPSFNLFAIKATPGWEGATTEVPTTEFEQGRVQRSRASFRSYGSYAEAFADYARLITSQPRYAGALQGAATPEGFAGGMQRGGYATDPNYALKLARTINQAVALQRALG